MKAPITYQPEFIKDPAKTLAVLQSQLTWVRRDQTPRSEYYINLLQVPYTYGRGQGVRTYAVQPMHPLIQELWSQLEALTKTKFEVCFLNRYHDQSDHLGWHADDSPEMDDDRPIAIISLGAEREIWFCPQVDKTQIDKLALASGSLCLMAPGMQNTHFHRIPKAGKIVGERISLTFRGYRQP